MEEEDRSGMMFQTSHDAKVNEKRKAIPCHYLFPDFAYLLLGNL